MKNSPLFHGLIAALLLLFMLPLSAGHHVGTHSSQPTLTDFDGTPHTLSEYTGKGKWLVVKLWAHDCHICNREAKNYIQFHERHKGVDATVLGISMDGLNGIADAQAYLKRHRVSYPNLIGSFENVAQMFVNLTGEPWRGTPTFLIFAPNGDLMAQQAGAVPIPVLEEFIRNNS